MSRAFVSLWSNRSSSYGTDYHKIFYDHFVETFSLWQDLVDKVYIVDERWGFTIEDKKRLTGIKQNVVFINPSKAGFLHLNFKEIFNQVTEDEILFMEEDCIIYNRKGVQIWFDYLKDHDCVVTLSEGNSLREIVFEKFPKLKERNKPGIWLNHFLVTRKFLSGLSTRDMQDFQPFPENTYIPGLDYYTRKGDWGEYCCMLIFQMMASNWIELPFEPDQGFKHLHWGSWGYLIPAWKEKSPDEYKRFLKEQPTDRYLRIMNLFFSIDTKGKYDKEVKEIIFDLLKKDLNTL